MKVVNPNDTRHTIKLISRFNTVGDLNMLLYNESTQVENNIKISPTGFSLTNHYQIIDGYFDLTFDFVFSESDKFRIKIADFDLFLGVNKVIYRGKLIAITEETQNFLADNNEFYYE